MIQAGFRVISPVFMVCFFAAAADQMQSAVELQHLSAVHAFPVTNSLSGEPVTVSEIQADSGGIWFLVRLTKSGTYSIVTTDASGRLLSSIPLAGAAGAGGLALTKSGPAVFIRRVDKQIELVWFDRKGIRQNATTVPCAAASSLMAIEDSLASLCPDGTLTIYSISGKRISRPSWARVGTVANMASPQELVIADQNTGQLLLNNISTQTLSVLPSNPEIQQHAAAIANAVKQVKLNPNQTLAPPVVIQASTKDPGGFYFLLYPYNERTGPVVIKVDKSGGILGRYQCAPPANTKLQGAAYKLAAGNDQLAVLTTRGEVVIYRIR